jgi:hypothetical protein
VTMDLSIRLGEALALSPDFFLTVNLPITPIKSV